MNFLGTGVFTIGLMWGFSLAGNTVMQVDADRHIQIMECDGRLHHVGRWVGDNSSNAFRYRDAVMLKSATAWERHRVREIVVEKKYELTCAAVS